MRNSKEVRKQVPLKRDSLRSQPGKALVIAVCLIGFGILGNWYLVQVQPLGTPNPRLRQACLSGRQGFGGQAYQQLYDELLRPSVLISTTNGRGSGIIIETTNEHELTRRYAVYILSAAHVVGDESTVDVTFYYYTPNSIDTTITASVVATDTLKDLALIRAYTYKPYPYVAKLAPRTYRPYIFTPVWVIGCSLGYPPRPTSGEVTAINSHWDINAPIWPGNSGGGIFLKDSHELIGIAVMVKVYRGQLVSTMGSIVTLQDIYKFLAPLTQPLPQGERNGEGE